MSWCEASKAGDHQPYVATDGRLICARCGVVVAPAQVASDEQHRPKATTQAGAVLEALERGPVCSFQFYAESPLTHRIAARIYDLKGRGYAITQRPCTVHPHAGAAVLYELESATSGRVVSDR